MIKFKKISKLPNPNHKWWGLTSNLIIFRKLQRHSSTIINDVDFCLCNLKVINIVILLLLVPAAYGSYAVSSPKGIILLEGDSKEFDFQIQAYASEQDLICTYNPGNTTPFEIIFEKDNLEVGKGSFAIVKGIVKAPKKIDKGSYSYDFCVSCSAKTKLSGAATNVRYCGIPIDIEILEPEKDGVPVEVIIVVGLMVIFLFIIIRFAGRNKKFS